MNESTLREQIALHGKSLFERGYGCGSSSNIKDLVEDGLLVTPTNSCMDRLDPARITKISPDGELLAGDKPSKEAFLYLAMYRERSNAKAIVHLHSAYSVALSRIKDIEPTDVLPPITAYAVMRAGKLPSVPYFRPSDMALAEAVAKPTKAHHAVLLANHGPVVAGKDLDSAIYAAEKLEEAAKLHLLLRGCNVRLLTAEQVVELREAFPS